MCFPLPKFYNISDHTEDNRIKRCKSDCPCQTAHNGPRQAVRIEEKQKLSSECNAASCKCDISFSEFPNQRCTEEYTDYHCKNFCKIQCTVKPGIVFEDVFAIIWKNRSGYAEKDTLEHPQQKYCPEILVYHQKFQSFSNRYFLCLFFSCDHYGLFAVDKADQQQDQCDHCPYHHSFYQCCLIVSKQFNKRCRAGNCDDLAHGESPILTTLSISLSEDTRVIITERLPYGRLISV